jgi:hypothetical protein
LNFSLKYLEKMAEAEIFDKLELEPEPKPPENGPAPQHWSKN